MKTTASAVLLSLAALTLLASAAVAQIMERPANDLMAKEFDTKVITVGDMVHRGVWSLAHEVFDQSEVARIGQGPLEMPTRGIQLLIFTPGVVGVTVRYHW